MIFFKEAKPVWIEGRETEKNLVLGFVSDFKYNNNCQAVLRITGSTDFKVYVNGQFVFNGPDRAAHGYFRVRENDLTHLLEIGNNVVAVEIAGYNVNSYYLLDQPSFLQAEIEVDGNIVANTGNDSNGFEACVLNERIQKVQRYSFQRPFIEAYDLSPESNDWKLGLSGRQKASLSSQSSVKLLESRVALPDYDFAFPLRILVNGKVEYSQIEGEVWKDRSLTDICYKLGGYNEDDLDMVVSTELQKFQIVSSDNVKIPYDSSDSLNLESNDFCLLEFERNLTGFLSSKIECSEDTRLFFFFDEIINDGDINFHRGDCINAISYDLKAGFYELESFEPYTLKGLKILVAKGSCTVKNVHLKLLENSEISGTGFECNDSRLNDIYDAAVSTFCQNAVDIFMDCPSRERAGWLCDSFFTARVAMDLCGNTKIEKNFLENYLLAHNVKGVPDGMLPMCYPADHNDGNYIPNWAMWLINQLDEYLQRSGDMELVQAFKPQVLKLIDFFENLENEYGLLENLPAWVFIEWSKANEFVQDVNYPSNMHYQAMLRIISKLYDMPQLEFKADRIKQTIIEQSFDGEFFVDNAIRRDGKLEITENRTETCQYYAFYFGVVTPQTHNCLWLRLRDCFGPHRKERGLYPEIHEPNLLIGNVLRTELLSKFGVSKEQIVNEIICFYDYMAQKTGTLWENVKETASCNHGFASHVIRVMHRDVLGIECVDNFKKIVYVNEGANLDYLNSTFRIGNGMMINVAGNLKTCLTVPDNYVIRHVGALVIEESLSCV